MTLEEIQSRIALGERVIPPIGSEVSVNKTGSLWFNGSILEVFWIDRRVYLVLDEGGSRVCLCISNGLFKFKIKSIPEEHDPFKSWIRY